MSNLNLMTINMPVCILGLILAVAAAALAFKSRTWSPLVSFIALAVTYFWGRTMLDSSQFYFWGSAALIAWGIYIMLPRPVAASRVGMGYIVGGTLAGALVGLIASHAWLVLGAMLGAFCGALAYSRTPSGAILQFPSSKFLHYLCAKGLPAVVMVCILGFLVEAVFAV